MTPTATQWRTILTKARAIAKEEDGLDDAFKVFTKKACPSSYPPFFETNQLVAYWTALEIIFPGIHEDISYWVYDVPDMAKKGKKIICTAKGKEYDVRKIGEYIKFLIAVQND